MPYILLGVLAFWIAFAAMKAFARANPASLARIRGWTHSVRACRPGFLSRSAGVLAGQWRNASIVVSIGWPEVGKPILARSLGDD
jgi:hypothetical protein